MIPYWAWIALAVTVVAGLAVDLAGHRGDRVDSRRRAVMWSAGWIALGLLFNAGIVLSFGRRAGTEFLSAYVLEKSLSVDNLLVFLFIFESLRIPLTEQRRVLFFGIAGALVTRGAFIAVGAGLVARWHFILYAFGAFLLFTGIKSLLPEKRGGGVTKILALVRRHLPFTEKLAGHRFLTRAKGRRVGTPLLMALIVIEITDLIFAVDSVPSAFSVTRTPFLIYSSNVLAVMGLRALYVVLAGALKNARFLRYGLAAVLVFVGGKMLLHRWVHVSPGVSLCVIVGAVGVALGLSRLRKGAPSNERARPCPRAAPTVSEPGA